MAGSTPRAKNKSTTTRCDSCYTSPSIGCQLLNTRGVSGQDGQQCRTMCHIAQATYTCSPNTTPPDLTGLDGSISVHTMRTNTISPSQLNFFPRTYTPAPVLHLVCLPMQQDSTATGARQIVYHKGSKPNHSRAQPTTPHTTRPLYQTVAGTCHNERGEPRGPIMDRRWHTHVYSTRNTRVLLHEQLPDDCTG